MFNLEEAIAGWRRQMAADGIKTPVLLDELESHLRDDAERQICSGLGVQEAFETAVRRIGQAAVLKTEFAKIEAMKDERKRRFMRIYCAVFPVFYSLICAYGLWKMEMSLTERIFGFIAVALAALFIGSMPFLHRLLPVVQDNRLRLAIQTASTMAGLFCGVLFMNFVLPRLNLTSSQVTVTVLWVVLPMAVISSIAYGLGDAARRHALAADS